MVFGLRSTCLFWQLFHFVSLALFRVHVAFRIPTTMYFYGEFFTYADWRVPASLDLMRPYALGAMLGQAWPNKWPGDETNWIFLRAPHRTIVIFLSRFLRFPYLAFFVSQRACWEQQKLKIAVESNGAFKKTAIREEPKILIGNSVVLGIMGCCRKSRGASSDNFMYVSQRACWE